MASASLTPSPSLSNNDCRVLEQVFDPESAPELPDVPVDPHLPVDPHIADDTVLDLKAREVEAIKLVESISVDVDVESSARSEERHTVYLQALNVLDAIVQSYPKYASAYNNRAQLRRWRYGDKNTLVPPRMKATETSYTTSDSFAAMSMALEDLDTVIRLASPPNPRQPISPSQQTLLASAWTQRAAIFWTAAKDLKAQLVERLPEEVNGTQRNGEDVESAWASGDQIRFEEEGSKCFFMAGVYGSEVGKAMAVFANPHARLCGNIVKEALRREQGPG